MGSIFDKLKRELKFKLSDTTLTSDVNQTLSNLLSQTNKNKKTIATVSTVANTANVRSVSPSLALEGLTDVVISGVLNGQTILWNGVDWVNGSAAGSFTTSGQGWFAGPGMTDLSSLFVGGFNAAITNYAANTVVVCQFVLTASWKLSKVAYKLSTTLAASHFNFGIYDASGNKLIESGTFDGSISTTQTNSFTAVTLSPGVYYFAASATSTTIRGPAMQASATTVADLMAILDGANPLVATAANATSGNVMPSTLGALTAASTLTWQSIPYAVWQV